MSRSLLHQTQVTMVLSLNVYRRTGCREWLHPIHLLALTPLLFWLWDWALRLEGWWDRLAQAQATLVTYGKLVSIGTTALAFGLGVRL